MAANIARAENLHDNLVELRGRYADPNTSKSELVIDMWGFMTRFGEATFMEALTEAYRLWHEDRCEREPEAVEPIERWG